MGRLDFYDKDYEDLLEWIKRVVNDDDYIVINARDGEIVIKPKKSTHTFDYGWILLSPAKREEVIKKLREKELIFQGTGHFAWRLDVEPYRPGGLVNLLRKIIQK